MTNSVQPAFPVVGLAPGLTKREYMATMILQGLVSIYSDNDINAANKEFTCNLAVKIADQLLNELNDKS